MCLCRHYFLDVQELYRDFRLVQLAEMMYFRPTRKPQRTRRKEKKKETEIQLLILELDATY